MQYTFNIKLLNLQKIPIDSKSLIFVPKVELFGFWCVFVVVESLLVVHIRNLPDLSTFYKFTNIFCIKVVCNRDRNLKIGMHVGNNYPVLLIKNYDDLITPSPVNAF